MMTDKQHITRGLKWLLVAIAVFSGTSWRASAQYDPIYSQYTNNTLAINPAYAGSRDVLSLQLLSRNQWMGFNGAPVTQSFTAHTPLQSEYTSAGLSITHDVVGPVSQLQLFADYAFRVPISYRAKLAFGLSGGITQLAIDFNNLERSQTVHDPAYDQGQLTKSMPNFGFGIYLNHPAYFFGLSVPRLVENDYTSTETGNAVLSGHENRNYFAMAGCIIILSDIVKVKPSAIARYSTAAPLTTDINLSLILADKLWIGALMRPETAWGAIAQCQFLPQFKVGYAVEFTTNGLQSANNGTHEIMVLYEFSFKKDKVFSPRYF